MCQSSNFQILILKLNKPAKLLLKTILHFN